MSNQVSDESAINPTPIILEGIVRQRCVTAMYNRTRMVLAPHILYTRGGSLYMDAAVVSRDFVIPREEKFGTYKLDGLKGLSITDRQFRISPLFLPESEKYDGQTLMKVEPEAAVA
ncbi:hypothetical protein [Sphingomonas turrisvirgatae]|uniref:WYL domain-containing protein n=1 Tax=Sphingomonas turrisvirgatae TaxID=1888892 RepID=A0A1E3LR50_9SPHN|nr:hypothetical protein [Sphingomonas turrisvirgatae]ODP36164.1 hypothetical protein BFL28_07075 [Sphingomonas turrisvirgatae]